MHDLAYTTCDKAYIYNIIMTRDKIKRVASAENKYKLCWFLLNVFNKLAQLSVSTCWVAQSGMLGLQSAVEKVEKKAVEKVDWWAVSQAEKKDELTKVDDHKMNTLKLYHVQNI